MRYFRFFILCTLFMSIEGGAQGPQVTHSSLRLEKRVQARIQALLHQMTLEEKVGQMTQVTVDVVMDPTTLKSERPQLDRSKLEKALWHYHVGSILNVAGDAAHSLKQWHTLLTEIQTVALQDRLKVPVLYGVDSIHGAQYTKGATIFPQSIAMAATWEPQWSQKSGEITALETRISGIPWNFFPVLDLGRQVLWPRFYETYGEDVYLAQAMGRANIIGQQGTSLDQLAGPTKVASCMKHYVGYSFPWTGKDRTPAIITERMMREYFLPTFRAAVDAGAQTVMINSGEVDGIPGHANYHLITEVLKGEMGFKGLAVSDWEDIKRLYTRDHMASSPEEAVQMAVLAGVDMSMVPFDFSFSEILIRLVREGKVPMARIDDAVARILRVKLLLGLFENPFPDQKLFPQFASKESTQLNLQIAEEAVTLLKNNKNSLPLAKSSKVLVTGPSCNSLAALNGGWTLTWQGDQEALYPQEKKTILEALQDELGPEQVVYHQGISLEGKDIDSERALKAAQDVDRVVLCLGEKTYTETPGNIDDLTLDSAQLEFAKALAKQGTPIVLVLVEGRPRVIRDIEAQMAAVVMAYLPGMEGGRAVARVLTGAVNPSGKLPFSYPRAVNALVPYDHKYQEELEGNVYKPQWPFGYGLSYTHFVYSDLRLSEKIFNSKKGLRVSVQVRNEGAMTGKEVVQMYVSDLYRKDSTPPVKNLKGFKKIELAPGETKTVEFMINIEHLSFIGPDNKPRVESGVFKVQMDRLFEHFSL